MCEETKLLTLLKQLVPEQGTAGFPSCSESPSFLCSPAPGQEWNPKAAEVRPPAPSKPGGFVRGSNAPGASGSLGNGVDMELPRQVQGGPTSRLHSSVTRCEVSGCSNNQGPPGTIDPLVTVEHIREFLKTQRRRKSSGDGPAIGAERDCSPSDSEGLGRCLAVCGHDRTNRNASAHDAPDERGNPGVQRATFGNADACRGTLQGPRGAGLRTSPSDQELKPCSRAQESGSSISVSSVDSPIVSNRYSFVCGGLALDNRVFRPRKKITIASDCCRVWCRADTFR